MEEDIGKWRGLFEWSMKYQENGSDPTVQPLTEEKKQWLVDAFTHYMQDWVSRMKEIKTQLEQPATSSSCAEQGSDTGLGKQYALLEELQDIVESLDFARDLHRIGGLPTLLNLLASSDAGLRWRAAEVLATCVANFLSVQQDFVNGGAMTALLPLLDDDHPTVQAKALLALSAITQHCPPAQQAFALGGGLPKVIKLCSSPSSRTKHKALVFLQRLLREGGKDTCGVAVEAGVPRAALCAVGDSDEHVVEAGLSVLVQVTASALGVEAVKGVAGWQDRLCKVGEWLASLSGEDVEATREQVVSLKVLRGRLGIEN